jgi:capsular exopolysaccharide synthesis family protein
MGMSAELGEGNLVNVRLVDEAMVPDGPSGPAVRRGIVMGGLLGLSFAIGLVFFLDYWDTAIYTVEDLRRCVPLPFLGMVPRYGVEQVPMKANGKKTRLLLTSGSKRGFMRRGSEKNLSITKSALSLTGDDLPDDPLTPDESSEVGERFKFIRGSLLMSSAGKPPKVTLITGPEKNAGKTFVACNLAASLAELGKKVLLIDADLRNPQIHRIFGTNNKEGLSSFLTGQADFESGCIHASSIPNVYLMTAGRTTPSPSELLSSEQMGDVLAECCRRFDYVLLDSAPLLPVFDSHMLTARCDASVLVVRSGKTNRAAIKTSLELVDRVGGKFSGVILNGVDPEDYARSYQYGYRGYGYGYGSSEKSSPDSMQLPA